MFFKRKKLVILSLILLAVAFPAYASSGITGIEGGTALTFLWIAIILMLAKFSSFIEKFGQTTVLGELIVGVILGNMALIGIYEFEPILDNVVILFLAKLGVVILMFQIGLESNIRELRQVGVRSFFVAIIGIIVPFALGTYVVGPYFLPEYSFYTHFFLGAILTATSVGVTASIFRDLNKLHTREAVTILGAAVIDDILSLIILAVVVAVITTGSVSVSLVAWISFKAIGFLSIATILGYFLVPKISRLIAKIQQGVGMKFTLAICIALVSAYLADLIGLAPIIGAFAAGLVLDSVCFKYFKDPKIVVDIKKAIEGSDPALKNKVLNSIEVHSKRHVKDIIEPIGLFLTPIFFVVTGMMVNLKLFFDVKILFLTLVITTVAFCGKIISGMMADKGTNKWIVGWGMVPRGEVDLVFAAMGKTLGVISDELFSVLVTVIILTTFIVPPILTSLLKKYSHDMK